MKGKGRYSASSRFLHYSYFNNFVNRFIDFLPPLLRTIIFKIAFGSIGKSVLIDYGCYFRYFNKIEIGSNVSINRGCRIFPSYYNKKSSIVLEDGVMIGPGVSFLGGGHDIRDGLLSDIGDSIVVKANAFIGANSTIRYGVTIGEGAVVAAGAVVVTDIPAGVTVVGVPARAIS